MTISLDSLPEVTILVAAALVAVTLAIALLRRLQKYLMVLALVVGLTWGAVLYPKYKDRISLPNLSRIQLQLPVNNLKNPAAPPVFDLPPQPLPQESPLLDLEPASGGFQVVPDSRQQPLPR